MATRYRIRSLAPVQSSAGVLVRPAAVARFWRKVQLCAHTLQAVPLHRHLPRCVHVGGPWCEERLTTFYTATPCERCCWPWLGCLDDAGYGRTKYRFTDGSTEVYAHRVAWRLYAHDAFPEATEACHQCQPPTRHCCNPCHISPGTHQVNLGTRRPPGLLGEASSQAKLTVPLVRHIWFLHIIKRYSQRRIAAEVGVSQCQVSKVVTRQAWKDVAIPDFTQAQ